MPSSIALERAETSSTPPTGGDGRGSSDSLVSRSLVVGLWTLASRLTGFVRVAVIAAVLGPTFFGNLFQTSNQLPNVVFELAVGQLIASLLVPAMVRHVDLGRARDAERVACGFLGLVVGGFAVVGLVIAVAAPVLLRMFAAGVDEPSVVSDQIRLGWPLIAVVMPQLALYGSIGVANAVQNTQRRFALAAAAPVVENVGIVATLVAYGAWYGTGTRLADAGLSDVMFLGIGSTLSVAAHAAVQWWGARRAGVRLVPTAGWRDAEVRVVTRLALPSIGLAILTGYQSIVVLVVAGRVAGGVVASQLALSFVAALVAVGARPVAVASLPELARINLDGHHHEFRRVYLRALALALFVLTPAAVILGVLSQPVAAAVSFGEMGAEGVRLVSAMLPWIALAVVGEGALTVATHASFARKDARTPFRAALVRGLLLTAGGAAAFTASGAAMTLRLLGVAVSISVVASFLLVHVIGLQAPLRETSPASERELPQRLFRTLASAVAAGGLAWLVARLLTDGAMPSRLVALAAGLPALALYGAIQLLTGAPELDGLRRRLPGRAKRPASVLADPSTPADPSTLADPASPWVAADVDVEPRAAVPRPRQAYRQRRRRRDLALAAIGLLACISALAAGSLSARSADALPLIGAVAVGLALGSWSRRCRVVLVLWLSLVAVTPTAGWLTYALLGAGSAGAALGAATAGHRARPPLGLARADWLAMFFAIGAVSLVGGPTISVATIGAASLAYVALRVLPGQPGFAGLSLPLVLGAALGLSLAARGGHPLRLDLHALMILAPVLAWVAWRERRRRRS